MSVNINITPHFYYRLNPACDRGKDFMQIYSDGLNAQRAAEKIVEECCATDWVPALYSDFGGISAFVFAPKIIPDETVFKDSGQRDVEGRVLWTPAVDVTEHVCLWDDLEKVPDSCSVKHQTKHEGTANISVLLSLYGRKAIAKAIGFDLKYIHPVEVLKLLDVGNDVCKAFLRGECGVKDILKGKLLVSKRENALKELAIKGEEEDIRFSEAMKGKEFGTYSLIRGDQKAVELYKEINSLPVIPQGLLNSVVGVKMDDKMIGFFIHQNWIWVQSSNQSELEPSDDFQVVSPEVWNVAVKDAQEKYG